MYNEKTTNRMKKLLSLLAFATLAATSFTSCLSDDDDSNSSYNTPTGYISSVYVVNAGSYNSNIDGSLSKITCSYTALSNSSSTSTSTASLNFSSSPIYSLGNTTNDIMIYGQKVYIVSTGDNLIYVYNRSTLSLQKTIDTQSLYDGTQGCQPRKLTAAGNLIYFTSYGFEDDGTGYKSGSHGYVTAIDTTSFAKQASYEVGSYPEDLVAIGETLNNYYVYVTNSDYGQGNGNISTINVVSGAGTVTTTIFDNIKNPTKIEVTHISSYYTSNYYLWIQDAATYGGAPDYAQLTPDAVYQWGGSASSKPSKAFEASMFAPYMSSNSSTVLYFVKDPYSETPSYGYYSQSTGNSTSLSISGIAQPCAIGVDPYTGLIYIASLAGANDYTSSGYANVYDSTGKVYKTNLNLGVNPTDFAFDFKYIYNSYTTQY